MGIASPVGCIVVVSREDWLVCCGVAHAFTLFVGIVVACGFRCVVCKGASYDWLVCVRIVLWWAEREQVDTDFSLCGAGLPSIPSNNSSLDEIHLESLEVWDIVGLCWLTPLCNIA